MLTIPSAPILDVSSTPALLAENFFLVTGTVPITAISARPVGDEIVLYMQDTGSGFIDNYPDLYIDDGVSYRADGGDIFIFKSGLNYGQWFELARNEASYVVDSRWKMKYDPMTITSSAWTDIPGLLITYTPRSNMSGIEITAVVSGSTLSSSLMHLRICRDGIGINLGYPEGSRMQGNSSIYTQFGDSQLGTATIVLLDKPEPVTPEGYGIQHTYKVQARSNVEGQPVYINRTAGDGNTPAYIRSMSTIKLQEYRGYVGS